MVNWKFQKIPFVVLKNADWSRLSQKKQEKQKKGLGVVCCEKDRHWIVPLKQNKIPKQTNKQTINK